VYPVSGTAARDDHARDADEVGLDVQLVPAGEAALDVIQAAVAEFQDQSAAGTERARRVGHHAVVEFEGGLALKSATCDSKRGPGDACRRSCESGT
jgi:hypothetical protein